MKKLTTVSLFIFGVVVTAILVAGLIFYQNKKDNQVANLGTNNKGLDTINQLKLSGKNITLNMAEIAKHNKQSDCWYLISGKVYNITSFFGSHPGGNSAMTPSCGKDATAAYNTQDPYATTSSGRSAHSSRAKSMLNDYYIGNLNQTIGGEKITQTNTIVAPTIKLNNYNEEDD
jgi:cytochrome b involved in lipid metabolism